MGRGTFWLIAKAFFFFFPKESRKHFFKAVECHSIVVRMTMVAVAPDPPFFILGHAVWHVGS